MLCLNINTDGKYTGAKSRKQFGGTEFFYAKNTLR